MKKCLKYMSEYWHWEYYIALVSAFVFLPIPRGNIFMIMVLTYVINAMSLSMFGMDSGIIYRRDGRDKLTLSLPMSRETIYDTRMYILSALYLVCILLSLIAYIPKRMYVSYLCAVSLFLFGHIMCGLCIRKPHCHILSGIPAFIVCMLEIWEIVNERVETSMLLKVAMGNISVVILAIDVFVWMRERRIFLYGGPKGNDISRNDGKNNDENIKAAFRTVKIKKGVLIATLAIVLILPQLLIYGAVFLDREMEYNRHGVTRYLVAQKTNCGFRDIGEYDGLDVRLYDIDSASFYTENHETIGLEKALNSNLISIRDMCKYPFEHKQITYGDFTAEDYIFETYQIIVTDTECIICPLNDIPEL